jgi:hypothetical protein
MSSREPGRPEYERRVVEWLRWKFLEDGHPVHYSGGTIGFEDVRLEEPGSEESSVVVTFRAPDRPGCLFGRREDAVGPPEPLQDPDAAPELWAQMIWIHLEEDIHTRPGIPKKREPAGVTWM